MSMDAIHLFADPKIDHWLYYCIASITIGTLLNVLGFALCRKDQKDFGFWSYLFGVFLCWIGLTGWNIQTEWGYFTYFLINFAFILLSSLFHRKIFMFFGSLGIICYIGHLAYIFSDSLMFSYVLGAIGFSIIMLATFLMRQKKSNQINWWIKDFPKKYLTASWARRIYTTSREDGCNVAFVPCISSQKERTWLGGPDHNFLAPTYQQEFKKNMNDLGNFYEFIYSKNR